MKICFVDNPRARAWDDARNRFLALETVLDAAGHDVLFRDAPEATPTNYLAGCERESDAAPLLASARVVETAKAADAALTIFPLRGGLAHGLLMARACGEYPPDRLIALWCDAPTRSVFLRDDATEASLSPLVADALERAALELADALILPSGERLAELTALGVDLPPTILAPSSLAEASAPPASAAGPIESLVFIGAFTRAAGVVAFIDAVEHLAARNRLETLEIVFAGPIGDSPFAVGRRWLGLRAARWRFRFRVVETGSLEEALSHAARPGALGVVLTDDVEELPGCAPQGLLLAPLGPIADAGARIARAVESRLFDKATQSGSKSTAQWPRAIVELSALPLRAPAAPAADTTVTVCTVHYERPALLLQAIDSIEAEAGEGLEIIIVDNGSASAESHTALDRLGQRAHVRVERLTEPLPYPVAYNHAAGFARGDYLVFLDDDNAFAPGGLQRLRRAGAMRRFDVIVSNLTLFDHDADDASSPGVMTFVGPARSAGLFFNAFGDTCLAIRREAFLKIEGFRDAVAPYPGADWVLLSRAQAAGLKIGVLQQPAYRYRRDPERTDANWQKFDRHGVRALVFDSYGSAYDPQLIAKFAQGLWLTSG